MNLSPQNQIEQLLSQLLGGQKEMSAVAAELAQFCQTSSAITTDAHIDLDRRQRCGYPEVIFAQGKTTESVVEIFQTLVDHGENCLATRVSDEQAAALAKQFPQAVNNRMARTFRLMQENSGQQDSEKPRGKVVVVTAGTSDRPVGEEALETLLWMGCEAELIHDIGVAGPHRLQQSRSRLTDAQAIVVAAGMEGALPSVVGGYVACPVIAVPTSVGYGASFGGIAALLGMLNSCASNVTVVNIDAGFKAGYVAGIIANNQMAGKTSVDS